MLPLTKQAYDVIGRVNPQLGEMVRQMSTVEGMDEMTKLELSFCFGAMMAGLQQAYEVLDRHGLLGEITVPTEPPGADDHRLH